MSAVVEYLEGASEASALTALTSEQRAALLEVVCLAVYADGYADEDEHRVLAELLADVPALGADPGFDLSAGLREASAKVLEVQDAGAASALLGSVASRLETAGLREIAFGMAAVLCLADGIVVDPERAMLGGLLGALEISGGRAREIVAEARRFVGGA